MPTDAPRHRYLKVQTLPGNFFRQGYLVAGYGKVAHKSLSKDDAGDYTPRYYRMFNRPEHAPIEDASDRDRDADINRWEVEAFGIDESSTLRAPHGNSTQ
jgi:hypothetical protein